MIKNIILNIDRNYIKYCAIFIISTCKYNDNVFFHILSHDIDGDGERFLKSFLSDTAQIKFYDVDSSIFNGMPTSSKWPKAIYYRLLIPVLLGSDIDKALYCDCDILIRGALDELFDTDLSDYAVAAVEDVLSPIAPMITDIGCNPEYGYFNSGVLLFNLIYCREYQLTKKCISFINNSNHLITHPDQDALNVILANKWKKLHYRWNFLTPYQSLYYTHDQMMSDYNKYNSHYPVILHFSGDKPWLSTCRTIYKIEYLEYFSDIRLNMVKPNHSIKEIIIHYSIVLLDKFGLRPKRVNYFY
ncbi:glycosyltransferase family 8 protein [Pectobacterium parvum]|uniref:glycosyltransferase family 8 protein n=1 Tax=Pectobacterium TaxID=122277 RepID=UPI001E6512B9|nr:glycosyltransferase family 8 protein [Pectobacterium parvum]UFK40597.1 glycosyltransferase family 8 protein [Pectobacterium parvum]